MLNFGWVVPARLAACGLSPMDGELTPGQHATLRQEGIDALVSLTEEPLSAAAVAASGLRYLHLPVPDMEAPTRQQIERFVEFVDGAGEDGLATAVHCRAGLGRTGTMLACYLTHLGATAEDALEQVRRQRPGSVETAAQEATVRLYARSLEARRRQRV